MCDPVSIGLTLAGSAMQGMAKQQVAHAQKGDINAMGQSYEAERTKQAGFNATNQATVADTLANYSKPNSDAVQADATTKRQAQYVSPLQGMTFAAPVAADANANSAVSGRNANTAGAAKGFATQQANAKGALDAYGDTQQQLGFKAANNASNIAVVSRNAAGSERAEAVNQGTLQSKLTADQNKGATLSGLGDLFTAAGQLSSMGAGGGFGAGTGGNAITQFGARNGISSLSNGLSYTSPFAGMSNGVYSAALPPI